MDEETRRALALAGVSAEQIELLEGRYDTAREDYRDLEGPQGRQAGRVFVAANPLEHIGHGLSKWAGRKALRKQKKGLEEHRTNIQAGRTAAADIAGQSLASEPVTGTRTVPQGPALPIFRQGHLSRNVHAQPKTVTTSRPATFEEDIARLQNVRAKASILRSNEDSQISKYGEDLADRASAELDRRYDTEQQNIENAYEDRKEKREIAQQGLDNLNDKLRFERDQFEDDRAYQLDKDELAWKMAGGNIDITDSVKTEITKLGSRLHAVNTARKNLKPRFAQVSRLLTGGKVDPETGDVVGGLTIPWTSEKIMQLSTSGVNWGKNQKLIEEAAAYYASWTEGYTLKYRNDMFGATLTDSEKTAWKSALEINPDSNYDYQLRVIEEIERVTRIRMRHRAEVLIAAGEVTPEFIDKAYQTKDWRTWEKMSVADKGVLESGMPTPENLDTWGKTLRGVEPNDEAAIKPEAGEKKKVKETEYTGSEYEEPAVEDWVWDSKTGTYVLRNG